MKAESFLVGKRRRDKRSAVHQRRLNRRRSRWPRRSRLNRVLAGVCDTPPHFPKCASAMFDSARTEPTDQARVTSITVKHRAAPGQRARPEDQRPSPLLTGPAVVVSRSASPIRGTTVDSFCFPGDHIMKSTIIRAAVVTIIALGLGACTGPQGPAGAQGVTGQTGRTGADTVIVSPTEGRTTTVDTVIATPVQPTKTTTTTTRSRYGY